MIRNKVLSRRTLLHGMGYGLALPLLDAMIPSKAFAQAHSPKRFIAFWISNGSYMGSQFTGRARGLWEPAADTFNATNIPLALKPLSEYANDMLITSGLSSVVALSDYKGQPAPSHQQTCASFLNCSTAIANSNGKYLNPLMWADSIDQIILKDLAAKKIYTGKSMLVSGQPFPYAYSDNASLASPIFGDTISWVNQKPVLPVYEVKDIVNSFFIGIGGGSGASSPSPLKDMYKTSHLDYMKSSIGRLKREIGSSDQRILNDYLDEVRELEVRAAEIHAAKAGTCEPLGNLPKTAQGKNHTLTEHFPNLLKFAMKSAVLGMKCDRVRVGGFMFTREPSNANYVNVITPSAIFQGANMNGSAHIESAHHGNDPNKIKRLISIHHFQMEMIRQLVQDLKSTPDPLGGGSLLDNSILMLGTGIGDGQSHTKTQLTRTFIGGKSMGLGGGRHYRMNGAQVSEVLQGVIRKMGVGSATVGHGAAQARKTFTFS